MYQPGQHILQIQAAVWEGKCYFATTPEQPAATWSTSSGNLCHVSRKQLSKHYFPVLVYGFLNSRFHSLSDYMRSVTWSAQNSNFKVKTS